MKNIYKIIAILSLLLIPSVVTSATILFPTGGGTGTSTAPSFGQLLIGNNSGGYNLVATSSLGISGGVTGATDSTLTLTGTTLGLNLGNADAWTNTHTWSYSSASTYSFSAWPTTATRNDANFAVGYTFQVSYPITINRLGRLYVAGNTQNHLVKLWQTSGPTLITSGTVLAASTSDANGFKWVSVTPVTLTPGVTYAIAVDENAAGDTWKDWWTPNLNSYFSNITAMYSGTRGAYPSIAAGAGKIYSTGAMDFSYTSTSTLNGESLSVTNLTVAANFGINTINSSSGTLNVNAASSTQLSGKLSIGTAASTIPTAIVTNTLSVSPVYANFGANGTSDVLSLWRDGSLNNNIGAGYNPLILRTSSGAAQSGTEALRIDTTQNVGIGTGATVSARLHVTKTTEQLRLGYDASNYFSATIGSTGSATFNLVGSSPTFTFNQRTLFPAGSSALPGMAVGYTNTGFFTDGFQGDGLYVSANGTIVFDFRAGGNYTFANIYPTADNTYDLGGSSLRFRNVYVAKLSLNYNSGSASLPSYSFDDGAGNAVQSGMWATSNNLGFSVTGTESFRLNSTRDMGIGTGATVSARLHLIKTTEQLRIGYDTSNYFNATVGSTGSTTFDGAGTTASFTFNKAIINTLPIRLKTYTVATLPTGVQGDMAAVSDALAPTYLGALVGGGAIYTPVVYNGTAWVAN